jgi:hypothetical protein
MRSMVAPAAALTAMALVATLSLKAQESSIRAGASNKAESPVVAHEPVLKMQLGQEPSAQEPGSAIGEQQERSPRLEGGGEPTLTVLDHHDVHGVLGKDVQGAGDEKMGRIVDVIVDQNGQVRAAVIDFGGFLGVGSRKIAVAWTALRFPSEKKPDHITLDLTRDQVRATPEYKEDKPITILGLLGGPQTLPSL